MYIIDDLKYKEYPQRNFDAKYSVRYFQGRGAYKRYVILRFLALNGICSSSEVRAGVRRFGVEIRSRQLLHYYIMNLVSMGLVRVVCRSNHGSLYEITERGRIFLGVLRQSFEAGCGGCGGGRGVVGYVCVERVNGFCWEAGFRVCGRGVRGGGLPGFMRGFRRFMLYYKRGEGCIHGDFIVSFVDREEAVLTCYSTVYLRCLKALRIMLSWLKSCGFTRRQLLDVWKEAPRVTILPVVRVKDKFRKVDDFIVLSESNPCIDAVNLNFKQFCGAMFKYLSHD